MTATVDYDDYSTNTLGKIRILDIDEDGKATWREPVTPDEQIDALTELVLEMHRKLRNLSK